MAKKNAYREEGNPLFSILYIIAVIALVATLIFMYRDWQNKQRQFSTLVREVSATETTYNIEDRKKRIDEEDAPEEGTEDGQTPEAASEEKP